MATDEMRKKWGTIFMGERESSVEELSAMHERLNREKAQKEQAEDYMERVRARAQDRAREILGAAYTERQKVLDEAKAEAAAARREAARECANIKGEGEDLRRQAQGELDKAQAEREEAERIRAAAHEEGYRDGMAQAGTELQEFRAELGNALGSLLRAIERERRQILENWREDLADLTRAAAQAGTGLVLRQEHDAMLRQLVFQALDYLEARTAISLRVNPAEEEQVSDMFRAARERIPELKQWTVHGDANVKPGGLIADSGSGSVDLRRENFQEMVEGVLSHLSLPAIDDEEAEREVASLVEQEVAHIASMTPEPDQPGAPQNTEPELEPAATAEGIEAIVPEANIQEISAGADGEGQTPAEQLADPSLAELEDELFPLDELEENAGEMRATASVGNKEGVAPSAQVSAEPQAEKIQPQAAKAGPKSPQAPKARPQNNAPSQGNPPPAVTPEASQKSAGAPEPERVDLDSKILSEGGFL